MKLRYLILTVTFTLLFCFELKAESFSLLDSSDVSPAIITRQDTFDINSIKQYPDSSVDVYLEYGFEKLFVQTIMSNDTEYTVEVFQMTSDTAAFGVLTVQRLQCMLTDVLMRFSCLNNFTFCSQTVDII